MAWGQGGFYRKPRRMLSFSPGTGRQEAENRWAAGDFSRPVPRHSRPAARQQEVDRKEVPVRDRNVQTALSIIKSGYIVISRVLLFVLRRYTIRIGDNDIDFILRSDNAFLDLKAVAVVVVKEHDPAIALRYAGHREPERRGPVKQGGCVFDFETDV